MLRVVLGDHCKLPGLHKDDLMGDTLITAKVVPMFRGLVKIIMMLANFPDADLYGPVLDGATLVPQRSLIQLRVPHILGDGLGGNSGGDGEVGKVALDGLGSYFNLLRLRDNKDIPLTISVVEGENEGLGYRDIILEPLEGYLTARQDYTFTYTTYLPVVWEKNAENI